MEAKFVWLEDADQCWIPVKVLSDDSEGHCVVERQDKSQLRVPKRQIETSEIAFESTLSAVYDNLVNLEEFSGGALLYQFRLRYANDRIYTWIGSILVSINPYKQLPLYTLSVVNEYLATWTSYDMKNQLPPHVYASAGRAYRDLINDKSDQAFVISGESGAGKTETTKLILQFLSELAGSESGVEQEILQTNPVLESFGNSCTIRNNNSSRFGKWMKILFDPIQYKIQGALIVNYLLEKSRVVTQAKNERNYHIFYQLCSGAEPLYYTLFQLKSPDQFNYINTSGRFTVPGVSDEEECILTIDALRKLDFKYDEIEDIMRIVAGILHLGNIEFVNTQTNNDDCEISSRESLITAAEVLELSEEALSVSLTNKTILIQNEKQLIPLKPAEANSARDSISKSLFSNLFNYLVRRMNQYLSRHSLSEKNAFSIGILDIFGFEVFEENSFEQFCINYANERLQQYFSKHIFKIEQLEYQQEEVEYAYVNFTDNAGIIKLIDHKANGILMMLDEECRIPNGSDETLIQKMHQKLYSRPQSSRKSFNAKKAPKIPRKSTSPKAAGSGSMFYERAKKNPDNFVIKHYAGDVEYAIKGFLVKNREKLHGSLEESIKQSKCALVKRIFHPEPAAETRVVNSGSSLLFPQAPVREKRKSILRQFISDLNNLMHTLNSAKPHFIRCLKPNSFKEPNSFISATVLRQVQYSGLFEAIRIRRTGFSFRKLHREFYSRYRSCVSAAKIESLASLEAKEQCIALIAEIFEESKKVLGETAVAEFNDNIRVGKTKVFLRTQTMAVIESLMEHKLGYLVTLVQAKARGMIARAQFARMKQIYGMSLAALKSKVVEDAEDVLQRAEEWDVRLHILRKVRELLEFLRQEREIQQLLLKSYLLKDVDAMEAALELARKIVLVDITTKEEIRELIQNCEIFVHNSKETIKAKKKLLELIYTDNDWGEEREKESIMELEEVVVDSQKIWTSDDKTTLVTAENVLRVRREQFKFFQVLRKSVKEKDVKELKKRISQSVEMDIGNKKNRIKLIQNAKLVVRDEYFVLIEHMVEEVDDEGLENILEEVEELGWKVDGVRTIGRKGLESVKKYKERMAVLDLEAKRAEEIKAAEIRENEKNIQRERELEIKQSGEQKDEIEVKDVVVYTEPAPERFIPPSPVHKTNLAIDYGAEKQLQLEYTEIDVEAELRKLKEQQILLKKWEDTLKEQEKLLIKRETQLNKREIDITEREERLSENEKSFERMKRDHIKKNIELGNDGETPQNDMSGSRLSSLESVTSLTSDEFDLELPEHVELGKTLPVGQPARAKSVFERNKTENHFKTGNVGNLAMRFAPKKEEFKPRKPIQLYEGQGDKRPEIGNLRDKLAKTLFNEGVPSSVKKTRIEDSPVSSESCESSGSPGSAQSDTTSSDEESASSIEEAPERPVFDFKVQAPSKAETPKRKRPKGIESAISPSGNEKRAKSPLTAQSGKMAASPKKSFLKRMTSKSLRKKRRSITSHEYKSTLKTYDSQEIMPLLVDAVRQLDRAQMQMLLGKLRAAGMEDNPIIKQARDLCYKMTETEFLDHRIKTAIQAEVQDVEKLRSLIEEANKMQLESKWVTVSRKILEDEGDFEYPAHYAVIRDYTELFENIRGLHQLDQFRKLRTKESYTHGRLFMKKKKLLGNMLSFTKDVIPTSLYHFTEEEVGSKAKKSSLVKESISIFKSLLGVSRDRFHSFPGTLGMDIIKKAITEPLLRDEVFLQIIKQTTKNRNMNSVLNLFRLLYLCLYSFRPHHEQLLKILESHIASFAFPTASRWTTMDTVPEMAVRCIEMISSIKMSHLTPRAVTLEDIDIICEGQSETLLLQWCLTEGDEIREFKEEFIVPTFSRRIYDLFHFDHDKKKIQMVDICEYFLAMKGLTGYKATLSINRSINNIVTREGFVSPELLFSEVVTEVTQAGYNVGDLVWKLNLEKRDRSYVPKKNMGFKYF